MSQTILSLLLSASGETLYMVLLSSFFAVLLGLPLGVLLYVTHEGKMLENKVCHQLLAMIVNMTRSIPFVILMMAVIPLTRILVGTSIGTNAAIVPLSLCAIPFLARIIENALIEVPKGLIEAASAMGATHLQIIQKVLLPEAMPSMIQGVTLTMVSLVGYSAMAGAVGGGGLGDLAIRYGYQRFDLGVMVATIIIMIVIVQLIQWIGNKLAHQCDRR